MKQSLRLVRAALAALALTVTLATAAPALAQHGRDVPPAPLAGSPNASNPTANAVSEDALLQQLNKLQGRVTIPDGKAATLEQPQGREYRGFREEVLPWLGGIAILGMVALLAAFYFTKGRIRMEQGEESGRKILRFNAFERFTHWLTAISFIVLAVSGLNYIFGKRLLMPLLGPDAFAAWSQWAKYAHNFLSWPFMLGLLFMLVVWIRDNVPDRTDILWLKEGGGFLNNTHPPARRFNAGQKLVFWSVIGGGLLLSASGLVMLFPFSAADINGMQWAQYVHAGVGVLLIAAMLAHIYIGSLGMEGAYDAMGSGQVDLAWAKTHHKLWVEEEQAKTASGRQLPPGGAPAPAE